MAKLLTILLISTAVAANAETYRWVDANGVVNYSERKPRNVPEDQLVVVSTQASRPQASTAPTTPANRQPANTIATDQPANLDPEQQALYNELQEAELARQAKVAEVRMQNCEKSRSVLSTLQQNNRFKVNMPDGSSRMMDEDERQDRIRAANEGIARNCT